VQNGIRCKVLRKLLIYRYFIAELQYREFQKEDYDVNFEYLHNSAYLEDFCHQFRRGSFFGGT
jgi:hypothetical protein